MKINTFLKKEEQKKQKETVRRLEAVKPWMVKKALTNGIKISFSSKPIENEIPLAGLLREGLVKY